MDFKWVLFLLLLVFGAIAYYRDDLAAFDGPQGSSVEELDTVQSRPTAKKQQVDEPSTKQWY